MTTLYPLNEHIIYAAQVKLQAGMQGVIDLINSRATDGIEIPDLPDARIFDYVPTLTEILDYPALGIQELMGGFAQGTDVGDTADGSHSFAVVAYAQAPDQRALVTQLRRLRQGVVTVLMAGRDLEHPAGPSQGAWGLNFDGYRPGRGMGRDSDPQTWVSWTSMAFTALSNEHPL